MWQNEKLKDFDVAISTRVRIARNLEDKKFPNMLSDEEEKKILNKIGASVDKKKYDYFYTKDIDDSNLYSLVEKHIVSKEFANKENTAILQNKIGNVVCMINEEDHFRAQAFSSGFDIMTCYKNLKEFESDMNVNLKFAKSKKYGYLTACPTNIGTGIRVSVLLHLVGLGNLGLLDSILNQIRDIGLSVRGLYGENTSGYGNMYQISNQKTLGVSDEDIINKVSMVVSSIIEQERRARNILKSKGIDFEDKVYRSYGILKNARKISEEEAFRLLSYLRAGASMQIIDDIRLEKIQEIFDNMQENSLKLIYKEDISEKDDAKKRAEYIREELN